MLKSKDRDESHENEDKKRTSYGLDKKTTYVINKIERVDWTKKKLQRQKKCRK